jgi:ADP-ribose pyrophosphatase YjhB (NUDIX family)
MKHLHEVATPIFTVDVFIQYQDSILMFKRSETKKAFPGWWALPGGHIDEGENPLSAAIREAKEETGLALTPQEMQLKFVATHYHTDRNEVYIVFGFLAVIEHKPKQLEDNIEGTAQWIEKSQLMKLENVLPPVKYYFEHVLNNRSGIMYNYSTWNNSQLVKVDSELVDRNC